MQLTGIHHLTAISADAPGNKRFYTGTMGMRMVKKTVNQDDTSAYHLFYADALARPGTDLTFFDWPAPPEQRGTHSIARTGLRVAGPESFTWWKERLNEAGVKTGEIAERDGRLTLDFEDPEGQRLCADRRRRRGRGLSVGEEPGAGRAPDPRARADHAQRAGPEAHRRRAHHADGHARGAHLSAPGQRAATPCTSTRWAKAAPARSCTSRCSRTCGRRSRARAACITSRSARRTPNTTPGPSG